MEDQLKKIFRKYSSDFQNIEINEEKLEKIYVSDICEFQIYGQMQITHNLLKFSLNLAEPICVIPIDLFCCPRKIVGMKFHENFTQKNQWWFS